MALTTSITDGHGKGSQVLVTSRGQLVVAPIDFSTAYAVTAAADNTAYNFVTPQTGKRFVITDIILDAGKNVSATTAATVVIYEAASASTTTVTKTILSLEMLKNTSRTITGINLIVTEGTWVNIKTTDAEVTASLLGYYVDA